MARLSYPTALVWTLLAIACGGSPQSSADPVRIDGSSTVFPLSEAVAEAFLKANRTASLSVAFSGTRPGFERFCAGFTEIQNASRPISTEEQQRCDAKQVTYIELPVAYDGVTVIVHPDNAWAKDITVAELRTLWRSEAEGTVVRWSDVRAGWPEKEIHLFGPGTESGTFDYFTDAVIGQVGARKDYKSSSDDELIVASVAGDELALGFVGFGYFDRHRQRLRGLPVDDLKDDVGRGPVEPTASNISRGLYRPLSRPLFIYVNAGRLTRPDVQNFVRFYLRQAGTVAAAAGTIPLTGTAYELSQRRLAKGVTGTMYKAPDSASFNVEYLLNQ